jgi:uroporphyrinogen decarboxylase
MDDILKNKPVELDLHAAIANICRQGIPKRVFFFEMGIEAGIKDVLCDRFDLCAGLDESDPCFILLREIRIYQFIGLEFMRVFAGGIIWKGLPAKTTDPPPPIGPIQSWSDFENYPWPKIEQVDFSDIEWLEKHLPDNMAMWLTTYLFQQVSNLLGFVPFCMMLHENRDLVKAVIERVGRFCLRFTETMCQFSRTGAITVADDMGHKTATLIDPADIRELFIPWHKKIIQTAKSHGKLGLFHSCGCVEAIMDDLIDVADIDAEHSTQDVIEPITTTKRRWGSRVALLGGVDVDFITRAQPNQVPAYTRNILNACTEGGGFALGIGNSVVNSIPIENYVAMLAEARCFA